MKRHKKIWRNFISLALCTQVMIMAISSNNLIYAVSPDSSSGVSKRFKYQYDANYSELAKVHTIALQGALSSIVKESASQSEGNVDNLVTDDIKPVSPVTAIDDDELDTPESTETSTNTSIRYSEYHGYEVAEDIQDAITQSCDKNNMNPELIYSVIFAESRFHADSVSNLGCTGLMQLHPNWFEGDLYDIYNNVEQGTKYLASMINDGVPVELALMVYNQGWSSALTDYDNGTVSDYAISIISRL